MSAALPVLLAAIGGGAVAVALREVLATMPSVLRQLDAALQTLALAGRENHAPTEAERRRLGVVAGSALGALAVLVSGPGPLAGVAAAGPAVAGWAVARRQRRYRLRVERDVPAIAAAIADAVAGGGSLRAALLGAGTALEGPSAVELARAAADLELGLPPREALAGMLERVPSERLEALVAAVLSQERVGGDLADLLRRHALAAAQRQRAEKEARAATAQARLTGGMVVVDAPLHGSDGRVDLAGVHRGDARLTPRGRPAGDGGCAAGRRLLRDPQVRGRRLVSALLAAACALMIAASLWELIGERSERASALVRRRLSRRLDALGGLQAPGRLVAGLDVRIERAALEHRLTPQAVLAAKCACAVTSVPLALAAAPVLPGRLGSLVVIGVPASAFLGSGPPARAAGAAAASARGSDPP